MFGWCLIAITGIIVRIAHRLRGSIAVPVILVIGVVGRIVGAANLDDISIGHNVELVLFFIHTIALQLLQLGHVLEGPGLLLRRAELFVWPDDRLGRFDAADWAGLILAAVLAPLNQTGTTDDVIAILLHTKRWLHLLQADVALVRVVL